jgi:hypothetical protein
MMLDNDGAFSEAIKRFLAELVGGCRLRGVTLGEEASFVDRLARTFR